jgi:hypothetical protein
MMHITKVDPTSVLAAAAAVEVCPADPARRSSEAFLPQGNGNQPVSINPK